MKSKSFKTTLFLSFLSVIVGLGAVKVVFGFYLIQNEVVARAQKEVKKGIESAEFFYSDKLRDIVHSLELTAHIADLEEVKKICRLDYVYEYDSLPAADIDSQIALAAVTERESYGTRLIGFSELQKMFPEGYDDFVVEIRGAFEARPADKEKLKNVMAIEGALEIKSEENGGGKVRGGGRIINRRFELVDEIRNIIFAEEVYDRKPVGTVTVFQDDIRISTNVLDETGRRAVGTRVSEEVYHKVVESGEPWLARAFVVTDWYLTAYNPIRDTDGRVIGMLYVGILERPFVDLRKKFFIFLVMVIAAATFLAALLSYFLSYRVSKPVTGMVKTVENISRGDFSDKKIPDGSVLEINKLTAVFNGMAEKIKEREEILQNANRQLGQLNKSYLDLVGFVSHELKGILSSLVLNVYNLKTEVLGPVNEQQVRALSSVSRNLDYLTETIKNFLNLSRIEKRELELAKKDILIKEEVFDEACDYFAQQAEEKKMTVINDVEPGLRIEADINLMQVAANNLVGNAVKYGAREGNVKISSRKTPSFVRFEVYNDGKPIARVDLDKLFKKFSRLNYEGAEKTKGTGIGLFITREIIERHGGKIWVEAAEKGNSFIFQLPI